MLKKLILIGVFIGPLVLAGVLYVSISSDENKCQRHFERMTHSIQQANYCAVDEDCAKIELDHPNYGCGLNALINTAAVDEITVMNRKVTENGCRLYLPAYECELPSGDAPAARCVNNQCN